MSQTTDLTDDADRGGQPDATAHTDSGPRGVPGLLGRVPRLGVWAWSFVGFVVAAIIVCIALGAVSEIVLPMTFAAVLAVVFRPLVGTEPKVMGRTLDIHPLVVLVVTALGGLLGGIVGLILAVPAWVIAGNAISRLRSRGVIDRVAERAQPAVQHLLD
jgi:predicted PurR-regulated permease PerM